MSGPKNHRCVVYGRLQILRTAIFHALQTLFSLYRNIWNVSSELISLSSAGSLFQKRGPATQKDLDPNFSPVYLGSSNKLGL